MLCMGNERGNPGPSIWRASMCKIGILSEHQSSLGNLTNISDHLAKLCYGNNWVVHNGTIDGTRFYGIIYLRQIGYSNEKGKYEGNLGCPSTGMLMDPWEYI